MKILVVEDDSISRLLLQELLRDYGSTSVAVNGVEAVEAYAMSIDIGAGFDLICLDIMMPEMDGQESLRKIRKIEENAGIEPGKGAKILMTTSLSDMKTIMSSFMNMCDGYLVKPICHRQLKEHLHKLGFSPNAQGDTL